MLAAADYTFDLRRIFVGDYPAVFYAEIALRSVLVFAFAFWLLRFLGKRRLGQLSMFDFVIIIALGSAVGDPLFYDDVPLLPAVMAVTVVVALNVLLARVTQNHERLEAALESSPRLLVRRGVILEAALEKEAVSAAELNEMLRLAGVDRLRDVEVAVLEASGQLSVLRAGTDPSTADVWVDVVRSD